MFYEAKEGFAVSLDGVRAVRISYEGDESEEHILELLYNDQTAVTIQNSESRADLLPTYRAILTLLGCRGRCGVIRYCAACGAIEPGEERKHYGDGEAQREWVYHKAPRTLVDKSFDICDSHTWPQYRALCANCKRAAVECCGQYVPQEPPQTPPSTT